MVSSSPLSFMITIAFASILISILGIQLGLRQTEGNETTNRTAEGVQLPQPYTVTINAMRVADNDGSNKANITISEIQTWINNANEIYNSTGIRFILGPMSTGFLNDSDVNRMFDYPDSQGVRDASEIARMYPDKLVVFFRALARGNGFSGLEYNFVAMPEFNESVEFTRVQGIRLASQNWGQLAHEIAHYLGLAHTFPGQYDPGFTIQKATEKLLSNGGNVNIFDGDGFQDTPPDPGPGVYDAEGWDHCSADHASYRLAGTIIQPDRHNLMSYFPCKPSHISIMQGERMIETLLVRSQSGLKIKD